MGLESFGFRELRISDVGRGFREFGLGFRGLGSLVGLGFRALGGLGGLGLGLRDMLGLGLRDMYP